MSYYIVYDDFLPAHEFGLLKSFLGPNGNFPWNLSGRINDGDTKNEDMYFGTMVYFNSNDEGWAPSIDRRPFQTILEKLQIQATIRVKANLYITSDTSQVNYHAPHIDNSFVHQGALFFLTNCDAPTTMFDGVEIESKENRLLLFDPSTSHFSSSPTNALYRVTININYFGGGISREYGCEMIKPIPTLSHNAEFLNNSNSV